MKQSTYDYNDIDIGYYDEVFHKNSGIQSKWHHLKFRGIHHILDQLPYQTLLDIACGPGTFISTLPLNKTCTGIDIAEKQIQYASAHYANGHHHFIKANLFEYPFQKESFDVITSLEFIEHISEKDIQQFLERSHELLKPNGHLILTTPNYQILWPILEKLVSTFSKVNYENQHISHFNKAKLEQTVLPYGFKIISLRKYLFLSPFFAGIHWRLSDYFFNKEFFYFPNCGNLLLLLAQKK